MAAKATPVLKTAFLKAAGARELKKQEANANAVIGGFAQTIEAGFQAEVGYIVSELQKNKTLTYQLAGLMKNDSLVALLDGRLSTSDAASSQGVASSVVKKLRASATKFKHLKQTPAVIDELLIALKPTLFNTDNVKPMDLDKKLGYVCLCLAVTPSTHLPHKYFPDLIEVQKFKAACSQRFGSEMAQRLQGKTLRQLDAGFYPLQSNGAISCIFAADDDTDSWQSFGAGATVTVVDPFDIDTAISVVQNGRKWNWPDLKSSFEESHIVFPVVFLLFTPMSEFKMLTHLLKN